MLNNDWRAKLQLQDLSLCQSVPALPGQMGAPWVHAGCKMMLQDAGNLVGEQAITGVLPD